MLNVYIMANVKRKKCPHPKCGAMMQRTYVRSRGIGSAFQPLGWHCPECGMMVIG